MASKRINGDEVAHGEVVEVTYDRPYRWYWNPYGDKAWMPADVTQMSLFMEAGWSLAKPRNPLKKRTTQKMRDGSTYDYASTASDPSEAELAKMNGGSRTPVNAVPTATYYSENGDAIPNLPADPQSMKEYMALGLSLTPPTKTAGEVQKLRAV